MLFSNYEHDEFSSNFASVISRWTLEDVLASYRSLCEVVDFVSFSCFPFADEVISAIDCIEKYILGLFSDDNVLNAVSSIVNSSKDGLKSKDV